MMFQNVLSKSEKKGNDYMDSETQTKTVEVTIAAINTDRQKSTELEVQTEDLNASTTIDNKCESAVNNVNDKTSMKT